MLARVGSCAPRGGTSRMNLLQGPLRLIPRRSPPLWMGFVICVVAVAAAIVLRGALVGWQNALGFSATLFPALIVATLYAGPRWGWATLAAVVGIGLVAPQNFPAGLSALGIILQFVVSGAVTVAVCQTLRSSLLQLDEANVAQA